MLWFQEMYCAITARYVAVLRQLPFLTFGWR